MQRTTYNGCPRLLPEDVHHSRTVRAWTMEGVGEVILLSWSVYRSSLFLAEISVKKEKAYFPFSITIEADGT